MKDKIFDCLIVGSGPCGVNAAIPLVKKGLETAMIDGGQKPKKNYDSFTETFEKVRRSRKDQYELFLGKNFPGLIPELNAGESMSGGNRAYITGKTNEFLPIRSNIPITQSLAKGGLGQAWGAVCDFWDDEELEAAGLPVREIQEGYKEIIGDIGVSGMNKNLNMQPPIKLDLHGRELEKRYKKVKPYFDKLGFEGYRPSLALLTKNKDGRSGNTYNDLDYWNNTGKSVYRPGDVVMDLQKKKNFTYISPQVVLTIKENNNLVFVRSVNLLTEEIKEFIAKKIILSSGPVNTLRILLRSKNLYNTHVPFIAKSHLFIPCIHLPTLGKKGDEKEVSLCQFILVWKQKSQGMSCANIQLHSYKSLLLYKTIQYIPFSAPEALSILSVISSSLVIANVRFPTTSDSTRSCMLEKKGKYDVMTIKVQETREDINNRKQYTRMVMKALKKLYCIPVKSMHSYTTAHYAGGIPTKQNKSKKYPLSATINGQVNEFKNVFVADSSIWNNLPAIPPTLTMMVNARRIGRIVGELFF